MNDYFKFPKIIISKCSNDNINLKLFFSIRPSSRPSTPVDIKNGNIGNNNTNSGGGVIKKRISAVPRHSPLQSSPRHRHKSSPTNYNGSSISNPAPSLPMIGFDMDVDNSSLSPRLPQATHTHSHPPPPTISLAPVPVSYFNIHN